MESAKTLRVIALSAGIFASALLIYSLITEKKLEEIER